MPVLEPVRKEKPAISAKSAGPILPHGDHDECEDIMTRERSAAMAGRIRSKSATVALTLVVVVVVAASAVVAAPEAAVTFDLEAHRGGRGLFPENTLAAFRGALAIGVTTLETDLAVTRDGVVVISHDPRLVADKVRGPDGQWVRDPGPLIHSLSLAELKRFELGRLNPASRYAGNWPEQRPQDGERFPTLTELFVLAKAQPKPVRFNIETKITPTDPADTVDAGTFARLVVDDVQENGMAGRVTIQSFDWRTLIEVRKIAPGIDTACLTIESPEMDTVKAGAGGASPWHGGLSRADYANSLPRMAKAAGCRTWSMFWRNLTRDQVQEAHALGLEVLPWTVNETSDMARLIDWKVDGIITDYPDRLRDVMADKGLPLP
jgi:glycerophosphoryl diester phosphodiesterase